MEDLLKSFGVNPNAKPLGEGVEAKVYPLDNGHVLRVYKSSKQPTLSKLQRLKEFYESLDEANVSFEVPEILQVCSYKNKLVSVDKRFPGENLNIAYDSLESETKRQTIESYLAASEQIHALHRPYPFYGELLADNPVREATWAAFLKAKIQMAYDHGKSSLSEDVPEAETIVSQMLKKLSMFADIRASDLVHGDYYFPNVLVKVGKVTAVLDFNDLTVAGDRRMDLASAVIYLDQVEPATSVLSREKFINKIASAYGDEIRNVIKFYELYYALLFAAYTKQTDSSAYQWAMTVFKRTCL